MYNTAMAHRSHPSYRNTEVQKIENISMIPTSTKKKTEQFSESANPQLSCVKIWEKFDKG